MHSEAACKTRAIMQIDQGDPVYIELPDAMVAQMRPCLYMALSP
jgi:hypothetical protein